MTPAPRNSLVSIIMPAYNAERFVGRALESAICQTYRDLEIVVVDDGSNDRTAEIIRAVPDSRVRYLYQTNQGQGPARNKGLRASAGSYITFLDADDYYRPRKVERQVAFLETHPEFGAVFCNALHFYSGAPHRFFGRSVTVRTGDIFPALLRSSLINPNTLMVRSEILRNKFAFCEDRYYPEEWDLCLRLSRAGVQFGYQDEDLVAVEIREDSNTTMDIQWILKKNALGMFERLFAGMPEEERLAYHAGRVLRRCKLNLAAAYLVAGDKAAFGNLIADILPVSAALAARTAVNAVPGGMLRRAAIRLWRWRQRRSFSRRPRPPANEMANGPRTVAAG